MTRKIKEAKDLESNELIYFKGHAKATYMSDGRSVEDVINSIGSGGGEGGITQETDPVFMASAAAGITADDIEAWNNKSDFSGNYSDLSNKPTIPSAVTEDTVSRWGFTKNKGTVTGVKINGNAGPIDTNGVVDLGYIESGGGSGAYPRVDHGTSDTTFTLTPNVFHVWDNVESLTLTFETAVSGVTNEYLFQFSCLDGQVTTLGLPEGIMWANGEVPTLEVLKTYQVSILNNCATIQSFG